MMQKLPPEILSKIFLQTVLLVRLDSGWGSTRRTIAAPLRISHVSETWRDIALCDGRLWSRLYIDSYALENAWGKCDFRVVFDTWIARSGRAPLNYVIKWNFKRSHPGEEGIKRAVHIVTILIKEHHRWGNVNLDCRWEYAFPEDLGPFYFTDMPMLKSLRLWLAHQPRFTLDLGRSSQLKEVKLHGNFSIIASESPLRHLKEPSRLSFRDDYNPEDTVRSCQNFLSITPFLEELHLNFDYGLQLLSPLDNNPPAYRGLRRLKLFPYQGAEVFIDNVTLPSLEALHFPCDGRDGGQKLLNFLERSLPPLIYLSIHEGCAHEENLIPCLRLLPTLEHLYVTSPPASTRFFRELTIRDNESGNITCPLLEALHMYDIKPLEDSDSCIESLITMLESRSRISKAFEKVWFCPLRWRETIYPSRLREYDEKTKEGLFSGLEVGQIWKPFEI